MREGKGGRRECVRLCAISVLKTFVIWLNCIVKIVFRRERREGRGRKWLTYLRLSTGKKKKGAGKEVITNLIGSARLGYCGPKDDWSLMARLAAGKD